MSTAPSPVKDLERMRPAKARELAGLTPNELAKLAPCALSTVYRVEDSGKWPKQSALRSAYQSALRKAIAAKATA